MIYGMGELPGCPNGDVIMIQRDPPKETSEGGLLIPKTAQQLECFGTILHAGLSARDKLYDNGDEIGDYVSFGKFASVLGEWDRFTSEPKADCKHDWSRAEYENEWRRKFVCDNCGAGRTQEAVAIMLIEDVKVNYSKEERMRKGLMRIARGVTPTGQTQHYIERAPYPMAPQTNTITTLTAAEHFGGINGRS